MMMSRGISIDVEDEALRAFTHAAADFQILCECSELVQVDKVITADLFLPYANKLKNKSPDRWPKEEVEALAAQLRGAATIDMRASSPEAASV